MNQSRNCAVESVEPLSISRSPLDKHMSIATLQALMGTKRRETTLKEIHLARTNLHKERVETAL